MELTPKKWGLDNIHNVLYTVYQLNKDGRMYKLHEKQRRNKAYGIGFSKGTVYFYSDFAQKHIKPEVDGVELYSDKDSVAFKFVNSPEAFKLHRSSGNTAYVMSKSFAEIMSKMGFEEKTVYEPIEKGGFWTCRK